MIMRQNTVEGGRPQKTKWSKRIAYSITKAINTHSYYVIFIAFPLEKFALKRLNVMLCVHCLSCFPVNFQHSSVPSGSAVFV